MSTAVTELIPHRPPFLFVDEIVAEAPDGLTARRTWRPDEDFYRGHYPGAPITPGVLLCESVFQTAACFVARLYAARAHAAGTGAGPAAPAAGGAGPAGVPILARIGDVRFRSPVYPGDTITVEVRKRDEMAGFIMMTGAVKCGDRRVLNVDFSVAWKTPGGAAP